MDLQTMKTQMNAVIQKHQIVVNEMRNDPQNPILQKKLHELQLEIASLNARQTYDQAQRGLAYGRVKQGYGQLVYRMSFAQQLQQQNALYT